MIRFWGLLFLMPALVAYADESGSVSPYIDSIKAHMQEKGEPSSAPSRTAENPDPYIQSLRKQMKESGEPNPQSNQPYIDRLKAKNPSLDNPNSSTGYAEEQSKTVPPERGSAIEAVKEGKSELHMKRPGKIRGSIGFKIGAVMNHSFSADQNLQANAFSDIYGNGWAPDLTLFAEYKPLYSETFGSLGIIFQGQGLVYKAPGHYNASPLYQPDQTTQFSSTALTHMTFISVMGMIGAKYQFNLTHVIRPYAYAGPAVVGMSENRDDGFSAKKAVSKAVNTSAGASFMLDWLSKEAAWDFYQDFGIKHFYLNVEYTKLTTISSPVDVSYSGLSAGFQFDF